MALEFILKRDRYADGSGTTPVGGPTPTTISGLHGTDIILSLSQLSIYVITGGQIAAHVLLNKIGSWNINGNRVIIYSLDETPLELTFLTANEAQVGLLVIEQGINNLP